MAGNNILAEVSELTAAPADPLCQAPPLSLLGGSRGGPRFVARALGTTPRENRRDLDQSTGFVLAVSRRKLAAEISGHQERKSWSGRGLSSAMS
jgi:hypothetical protein